MKVLIYSINFAPEPTGIGKYSGEMASWLAKRGHEVRAVCAPPYYPQWKVADEYRTGWFRQEEWQGVLIWRAPLWVPKQPTGAKRILHLLSFAFSSFPVMVRQIFWRADLVLVIAPGFVCAPAALLTASLSGAKVWLHVQDFEIDIAFRLKLLKGAMMQRVCLRSESWILRRFDMVSSISARMVTRLLKKGVSRDRVSYFPNWVDIGHIKPSAQSHSYRRQLDIKDDAIVVLYSGSLGSKQGLMVLPAAASLLAARSDIVFVICGDGVMKQALESACAELPNTRVIPLQPVERLGDLLTTADIHTLPQSCEAEDLVLPSKLSGMLASGRPVIATCNADTELAAVVSICGMVVEHQDAAALASAITMLADDGALRSRLGAAARSYAELNFERDSVLERFFDQLNVADESVQNDFVS